MINNRFTIDKDDLNGTFAGGTYITLDPKLTIENSAIYNSYDQDMYPIAIQVINDCGAELEYNPVLTETEWNLYTKDPTKLVFQRLQENTVLGTDHANFPKCYKFLIRAREATVTSDLIVEFINYK